jgi:hypothetical protein
LSFRVGRLLRGSAITSLYIFAQEYSGSVIG